MLKKEEFMEAVVRIFHECPGNIISDRIAICSEIAGIEMFEEPLVGIGSAKDPLYETFKEESVIGPWHLLPEEWLPGAKTVISFFFPFTEAVKKNSRSFTEGPSPAWLHGRIEGQEFILSYMERLEDWLNERGIANCVPGRDERFRKLVAGNNMREYACVNEDSFGSNWSERHNAYVCGLGTFGLSKGIITRKGMAGRFGSVIIDQELPADERAYTEIYEYCTKCGACIRRCPAHAISMEEGKDHKKCNNWLKKMGELHAPRFGCGLCQTKVPCESRIPLKR